MRKFNLYSNTWQRAQQVYTSGHFIAQMTYFALGLQTLLIPIQLKDPSEVRGRVEWGLARGGVEDINQNYEGLRIVRMRD